MLERKNRKNTHLLGLETWRCPEVNRTFRERREETEAMHRGRGRERGVWIRIRWRSCCRRVGDEIRLESPNKGMSVWSLHSLSGMRALEDRISKKRRLFSFVSQSKRSGPRSLLNASASKCDVGHSVKTRSRGQSLAVRQESPRVNPSGKSVVLDRFT